jgi:sulfate adenylyltransferase subunit 1
MAVVLVLEDEIDISRGDILVKSNEEQPHIASGFLADIVWMSETLLSRERRYLLKIGTKTFDAIVQSVEEQIDFNELSVVCSDEVGLNAIACVRIALEGRAVFDDYKSSRSTGAFILIDRLTNATIAAGMIKAAIDNVNPIGAFQPARKYGAFELRLNALIRKRFPHWNARDISKER